MRMHRVIALQFLASVAPWCLAEAQQVHGTVKDSHGQAIAGAVVLLIDPAGMSVARTLTDSGGEYRLSGPGEGAFRLRTLRIGYRPFQSDEFVLRVGTALAKPVQVIGVPAALDTIRILGRNECVVRPDSALASFRVWEQARTGLLAAEIVANARQVRGTLIAYEKVLHPESFQIQDQKLTVASTYSSRIWNSPSPDSLHAHGYIIEVADGSATFYAPDLDVLVSDGFTEDHCFRLSTRTDSSQIGLVFEPSRSRRRIPEIRGTFILDRRTSRLRRLEFTYANGPSGLQDIAGGEMEFTAARDGSWLITRWVIRIPAFQTRFRRIGGRVGALRTETTIDHVRLRGGELALVTRGVDTLWMRSPLSFRGRVVDASAGRAVAGARIEIMGVPWPIVSDTIGNFRVPDMLPGRYTIEISTASLDSVGTQFTTPVDFTDTAVVSAIVVPTAQLVAPRVCHPGIGGILTGQVWHEDQTPLPSGTVVAQWIDAQTGAADWREVEIDGVGRYRICNVALNAEITIRARSDSNTSTTIRTQLSLKSPFGKADLTLRRGAHVGAFFKGLVLSDVNGQPISAAEIEVPSAGKKAFTNERGAFRIDDLPSGTRDVTVRRLGYRFVTMALPFEPGRGTERSILLTRVDVLDTVAVVGKTLDRNLLEFEENRRLGLGRFWTRADLKKFEGHPMSVVLSGISGSRVVRGRGNALWMIRSRGPTSLGSSQGIRRVDASDRARGARPACYSNVILDNVTVYSGRSEEPLFDLNQIRPESIEAMEYYAGPAQTPARYATLNAVCGVLVIWTRRSP